MGVVIPFRESAAELPAQLKSIYSQTLKAAEIIIVDDASSSESSGDLRRILVDFPDIQVISCETHQGAAHACTKGAKLLATEYICFLSANDLTLPEFFERSAALLDKYPESPISIANIYSYIEASDKYIYSDLGIARSETYIHPELAFEILKRSYFTAQTNSCMFRRDFVLSIGGMPSDLQSFSDSYLVYRCLIEQGFCYVPAPLSVYVERKQSYSILHTRQKSLLKNIIVNYLHHLKPLGDIAVRFRKVGIFPSHDLWVLWQVTKDADLRWFLSSRFARRCILYSVWSLFRSRTPLLFRNGLRRMLVLFATIISRM